MLWFLTGNLEKQVLKQLEASEKAKEIEKEKQKQEDEQYEEKKRAAAAAALEKKSKQIESTEAKDSEDHNEEDKVTKESTPESETEPSTSSMSEAATPILVSKPQITPPSQPQTLTAVPIVPIGASSSSSFSTSTSKPSVNIDFLKEFEREPDPFEKAELQTLNDMQQLAEVLQTSSAANATKPTPNPNPLYSSPNQFHNTAVSSYPYYTGNPNQFYYQPRPYFPPTYPGKFRYSTMTIISRKYSSK